MGRIVDHDECISFVRVVTHHSLLPPTTAVPDAFGNWTHPHRLVNDPCIIPKKTAMTVELMIMTLYGIEKSGVGTSSSSLGVYILVRSDLSTSGDESVSASPTRSRSVRTPDEISRPRSASGRCSVYLSMSLVNGIVKTNSD